MVVQDRRERVSLATALVVAPRQDREPQRLSGDRGDRPGPEPRARRADRDRGRARVDAGAAAPRDPAAGVAGPLLSRGGRRARGLAIRRRDAHLPRPALARPGPGAAGLGQACETQELPACRPHGRPRDDRRGAQDPARGQRRREGDRRRRGRHRCGRNRGDRGPEAGAAGAGPRQPLPWRLSRLQPPSRQAPRRSRHLSRVCRGPPT